MKKHITSLIVLVMLMGCSKPISNSKFTKPFTLQENLFINHVTFNNLAFKRLDLDEKKIEQTLLYQLEKKRSPLGKKPIELIINLIKIEVQPLQKESTFNIHNIVAVTAMLVTGTIADTSSIDTNQVTNRKFILNLFFEKEETKLFIEINNYSDIEELKELFEAELAHKLEETF